MPIEQNGKDFTVQFTEQGDDTWRDSQVFADQHSAKQHAVYVLQSPTVASVRVVQTRLYGWRDPEGRSDWTDDIGERTDRT